MCSRGDIMGKPDISITAQKKIINYLSKEPDFDAAKYLGEYNGNSVFSAAVSNGSCPCVGYPPFYLVKGDDVSVIDVNSDIYDELLRM